LRYPLIASENGVHESLMFVDDFIRPDRQEKANAKEPLHLDKHYV
jgi:hypothetical protein